jgi:hypothetical protein
MALTAASAYSGFSSINETLIKYEVVEALMEIPSLK